MSVVLVLEAVCVAIGGTAAGIAAVVFVFLFEGFFTWGWMGCVWVVSDRTAIFFRVALTSVTVPAGDLAFEDQSQRRRTRRCS